MVARHDEASTRMILGLKRSKSISMVNCHNCVTSVVARIGLHNKLASPMLLYCY